MGGGGNVSRCGVLKLWERDEKCVRWLDSGEDLSCLVLRQRRRVLVNLKVKPFIGTWRHGNQCGHRLFYYNNFGVVNDRTLMHVCKVCLYCCVYMLTCVCMYNIISCFSIEIICKCVWSFTKLIVDHM